MAIICAAARRTNRPSAVLRPGPWPARRHAPRGRPDQ